MEQLILHLIGDYLTQSDWMASLKTKSSFVAGYHALTYSAPFLILGSGAAFAVILVTHFLIDRFRLARFVVYGKNLLFSPYGGMFPEIVAMDAERGDADAIRTLEQLKALRWANCKDTGYPSERPAWLAVWLLIAADNTMHLAINYCALRWL